VYIEFSPVNAAYSLFSLQWFLTFFSHGPFLAFLAKQKLDFRLFAQMACFDWPPQPPPPLREFSHQQLFLTPCDIGLGTRTRT